MDEHAVDTLSSPMGKPHNNVSCGFRVKAARFDGMLVATMGYAINYKKQTPKPLTALSPKYDTLNSTPQDQNPRHARKRVVALEAPHTLGKGGYMMHVELPKNLLVLIPCGFHARVWNKNLQTSRLWEFKAR